MVLAVANDQRHRQAVVWLTFPVAVKSPSPPRLMVGEHGRDLGTQMFLRKVLR